MVAESASVAAAIDVRDLVVVRGSKELLHRRRFAAGRLGPLRGRHDVAARSSEAIRVLVPLFEDRERLLSQCLDLAARLEQCTGGDPQGMLARLDLQVVAWR